jgi:sarcosine oxidase, subunit gamma
MADQVARGFVTVARVDGPAMITLRGAPEVLGPVVADVVGLNWPEVRGVAQAGDARLLWMSPDEGLLLVPRGEAAGVVARLEARLVGLFATVVEVSDARAMFTLTGAGWRDALAKLCPVDFGALPVGQVRRTRAGQVAVAIWPVAEDAVTLVCFVSVAEYMFGLLANAARAGSAPGLFA